MNYAYVYTGKNIYINTTFLCCSQFVLENQPHYHHALADVQTARFGPLSTIKIFTQMKLCLAPATHNFKWV